MEREEEDLHAPSELRNARPRQSAISATTQKSADSHPDRNQCNDHRGPQNEQNPSLAVEHEDALTAVEAVEAVYDLREREQIPTG